MSVIEMVSAFRTIHVLNDVLKAKSYKDKPILKATHYCMLQVNGRSPVWGIWTVTGRFVQFAGSKKQIEILYPKKAWTKTMASWLLEDAKTDFRNVGKRVRQIEERYSAKVERIKVEE